MKFKEKHNEEEHGKEPRHVSYIGIIHVVSACHAVVE
jgi:hypothetical protein